MLDLRQTEYTEDYRVSSLASYTDISRRFVIITYDEMYCLHRGSVLKNKLNRFNRVRLLGLKIIIYLIFKVVYKIGLQIISVPIRYWDDYLSTIWCRAFIQSVLSPLVKE